MSLAELPSKSTLKMSKARKLVVVSTRVAAKKATVNATLEATEGIKVTGVSTIPSIQGEVTVGSAVTIGSAGIATFSGGVDFNGGSILKEKVNIVAGKASDNTNINLTIYELFYFYDELVFQV